MEAFVASAPLFVETLRGRVLRNGLCKPLSSDQLQLCMALAVYRDGVSPRTLCNLLFPEMDPQAAMGRLKVSVHGVRAHLGPESIVFFHDSYRFSAGGFTSDLELIESLLAGTPGDGCDLVPVSEAIANLSQPLPKFYASWSWFGPVEERIACLARDAARLVRPREGRRANLA
ncbi:MAG TPA: hypothetical protein VIG32_01660 [Candidatus Baltobacteraceae bacterium]|jgi:hypothetical protein